MAGNGLKPPQFFRFKISQQIPSLEVVKGLAETGRSWPADWDNTVTPEEELSVNTDRFLRNFGPIHTDGRRPEVCID